MILNTMAISSSATTAATTTSEFSGEWWLPGDSSKLVSGVLRFDPEIGGSLELLGALVSSDQNDADTVIFGQAGSQLVTIPDGFRTNSSQTSTPSGEQMSETWKCSRVLVGDHIQLPDSAKFTKFSFRTYQLGPWTYRPIPNIEHSDDKTVNASISIPPPIAAHMDDNLIVNLRWRVQRRHSYMSLDVSVDPYIDINVSSSPMTINEFNDEIIAPTLFLLALCTGAADRVLEQSIQLTDVTGNASPRVLKVLNETWISKPLSRSKIYPMQSLIRFEDVEGRFEDFLQRWLKTYRNHRLSLLDFFSVPLTESMYVDESLLRTIRSLESWHREKFPDEQSNDQTNLTRILESLGGALPPEDVEFLKAKLNSKNEPSLKQRLESLVASSPNPISELLVTYKKFLKRCVATRNSLVHHLQKDDKFKNIEMSWAERTLRYVLTAHLLVELGFLPAEITECLGRTKEWRNLNSAFNVLRTSMK